MWARTYQGNTPPLVFLDWNLLQDESHGGDDEAAQEQPDTREPGGAGGQPPHLEHGGGPGH